MAMFKEGGKGVSVRYISPSDNRGAGAIMHALKGKLKESLPFIDFNSWEFIEPLLLLKVRCGNCTRTKGKERVEEALNSGDELSQKVNRSVFLRTLKGEHLDLDTLNSIFNAKTKWSNVFHLVILAMDIVRIAELGGSEAFPVARAHELLEECKIKFQASFGIV